MCAGVEAVNKRLQIELKNHLGIKEISYLASGDDSDTFLCDDRYVVKVPKRESVKDRQKREFQLYHFLNSQNLSFEIPHMIYQGNDFNVMNYLPGKTLTYKEYHTLSKKEQEAIAQDEAAFLRELHSISYDPENELFLSAQQNKFCWEMKEKTKI